MKAGHGRRRAATTSGIENNVVSHARSVLHRSRRRYTAWQAVAAHRPSDAMPTPASGAATSSTSACLRRTSTTLSWRSPSLDCACCSGRSDAGEQAATRRSHSRRGPPPMRGSGEKEDRPGTRPAAVLLVRHGHRARSLVGAIITRDRPRAWRLLERRRRGVRRRRCRTDAHRWSSSTTFPRAPELPFRGPRKCRGNWAQAAERPGAAGSAGRTGYGACLITLRTVSLLGRNWVVSPSAQRRRRRSCSSRSSGAGVAPSSSRRRWRSCS